MTQTLVGVNSSVFARHSESYKNIFSKLLEIKPTNIIISGIKDQNSSSSFSQSLLTRFSGQQEEFHIISSLVGVRSEMKARELTMITAVPSIYVDAIIAVIKENLGFSDTIQAYTSLSSKISDAGTTSSLSTQLASVSSELALVNVASVLVDASTLKVEQLHTTEPTSFPTLSPTCGLGSFGSRGKCSLCPPGFYTSSHASQTCLPCPIGTYSDKWGIEECQMCIFPFSTPQEGQVECTSIYLRFGIIGLSTLFPILFVMYIFMAAQAKGRGVAAILILLPSVLDTLSDLAYLVTSTHFNVFIFCINAATFLQPSTLAIIWKLYEMKGIPLAIYYYPGFHLCKQTNNTSIKKIPEMKLWWLGMNNGRPTVNGEDLTVPIYGTKYELKLTFLLHDTLLKACLYVIIWVVVLSVQILYIALFLLWILLWLLYYIPLTLLSTFSFQTKTLSISTIWNTFLFAWGGSVLNAYHRIVNVDADLVHLATMVHVITSVMQICVQVINNILIQIWSVTAIVSVTLSGTYLLSTFFHYRYYIYHHFLVSYTADDRNNMNNMNQKGLDELIPWTINAQLGRFSISLSLSPQLESRFSKQVIVEEEKRARISKDRKHSTVEQVQLALTSPRSLGRRQPGICSC